MTNALAHIALLSDGPRLTRGMCALHGAHEDCLPLLDGQP